MKNFIFFLLLFVGHSLTFGKGLDKDSLQKVIGSAAPDTARIRAYYELAWQLRQNPDTSIYFFKKGLALARKAGNKKAIALGTRRIGIVYRGINDPESALKYLNEALKVYNEKAYKIAEARNDTLIMARIIGNLSILFEGMKEYDTSMVYCKKSIAL